MKTSTHPCMRAEAQDGQTQTQFVRRGLATIERTAAARDGVPAQVVIERLQTKLAAAKANSRRQA